MRATPPRWQKERSEFNHDWLKNRFLPALAKWINILDGRVEDSVFQREFTRTILLQWLKYGPQARGLAERFESEMSPASLFDCDPLARMPTTSRQWMRPVVHRLWLSRYPVKEWIANATEAAHAAADAFESLKELMGDTENPSFDRYRSLRPAFVNFQSLCQALARAIEEFPSKMLIT